MEEPYVPNCMTPTPTDYELESLRADGLTSLTKAKKARLIQDFRAGLAFLATPYNKCVGYQLAVPIVDTSKP